MQKAMLNAENIISQDVLRQVEALCTQPQPPACTAACPLHLDARALCALVAAGDFAGAFKLYQKAVPFARLVAHTCDAPCQSRCLRGQKGGAVQLQLLEKYISDTAGAAQKPPLMLSKKPKKAAIAGGGLRGMAAAADLARKGYGVTLYEKTDALGGTLRTAPEGTLPTGLLDEEIATLAALRVQVVCGTAVPLDNAEAAAAFLLKEHDAAFVACQSPLDALADGDTLLVAGQPHLLAGRRAGRMTAGHSTVYDAYDGRSAALSIDRLFQSVNLMAGREKEGSGETRLYTNLDAVAGASPVVAGPGGFTAEEANAEAARCIGCECLECVKKCGFLQHYGGDPSRYVREVYNNLSIAMGNHHANRMINTCALCGQCEAVCPNGLDMRQVFLAARQRMVNTKKMPPSAHEFALLDMDYSLSDAFYTLRHQPGHTASAYIFFPGCQLAASEPALVEAAYADLCGRLEGGVGLWLGCCGVMANWAGDTGRFEAVKQRLAADWERMGRPRVVAACPTCATQLADEAGIATESLFETLAALGVPEAPREGGTLALHHACGARHSTAVRQGVRSLAGACGATLLAGEGADEESPCCGYGGLVPFVDEAVAGAVTETALARLPAGAPVLTYCVNCRDRYLAQGRSATHLLELVYPGQSGMNRRPPTWSARQENRAALKSGLLRKLWNESVGEAPKMELYIDEALEQKLQATHILHSDIAAAIARAEAENEVLCDPATGCLTTSHRPRNVTFWVAYTPEGAGWRVHNAWCHRMDAIVTDKLTESGAQQNG